MSKLRISFHAFLLLAAIITGGLSLWHDGIWMEGRNNVPNFTAIAMVFLVISQGILLHVGLKEKK